MARKPHPSDPASTPPPEPTPGDAPSSDGGAGAAPTPPRSVRAPEAAPGGNGATGGAPDAPSAPAERHRRPWWVRGLRALGALLAVVIVLVLVAAIVLLRTEWGRRQIQGLAVGQIQGLLAEGATVEVDRLEGNFLTGARMLGVVLRQDGEVAVAIDTLLIEYNLLTLLDRRFSADALYIGGPRVFARQRADSTWNLAHLLKPSDPDRPASEPFVVHMDSFGVQRGRIEARFYNPRADSVLVVDGFALAGSGFHSAPDSLTAQLDTLRLTAVAPGDAARIALAASGLYTGDAFALDALRLTSAAGTDVRGNVRVALGGNGGGLPPLDADLSIQPLALEDVRAFTGLPLYGEPRVRLSATTRDEGLTFSVQGAVSGGTVALDGTLRNGPGNADRLEYQVQGQLRGLNPAVITQNPALDADINGELRVDIAGTSLRTLDGPFALTVTDSRVGQQTIERVALDGAFRTGRITFDAAAAVPGARLRVEGEARPFDPTPTYDVEGEAEEVNLARLLRDPSQTLAFSGTFAVNGAGVEPETATAEARLALDRVRFGEITLDYFDADAELRAGALRFITATGIAGGGTVEAAGTAKPFADPLVYEVTSGRVDDLNLAALTGDPAQRSDLSGTFALRGSGTDPQTAAVEIQASLRDSSYGIPGAEEGLYLDLVALDFDGALRGGILAFDTDADLGRVGRIAAAGTARPFADPLAFNATGRVENLDLAELTGNPAQQSDLTTAFRIEGAGTEPQTMALTAHLDVAPSSYGAQEVTEGALDLTLRGGAFTLTGDLVTPEGQFALDVSGRPFDATPTFALGEATCFSGLDLAALTGNPDVRTRLAGCFRGTITGFDPATSTAEGTLTVRESTVNEATIAGGEVAFTLREGQLDAAAELRLADTAEGPGGRLDLTVTGRLFDETPTYALDGAVDQLDLNALLGLDGPPTNLSLRFDLEGAGTDPETLTARGLVTSSDSRLGEVTVDSLAAAFALDRGVLDVDTLFLVSNVAEAEGGGRLVLSDRADAPASAFRLRADIEDLAPLSPYLSQPLSLADGTLDLEVMGEAAGPLMFDVSLVAERLAYGTTALSGLDGRVTGTFAPDSAALDVRARLEFDYFAQPGLLVEKGDLDVVYTGEQLTVEGDVTLDRTRDFQFFASLDFAAETPAVELERFNLNVDGEPWALAGPARITYGDEYRVQNLLFRSQTSGAQIAADGVIDPDGEQAFVLTIEQFQIGGLTDLIGYQGLGGELSTALLMTGPAANPVIAGNLRLDDFTSRGQPIGSLDVAVDYGEARLGLSAALTHVSGRQLLADGFLPVRFSLAPAEGETAAFTEGEGEDDVRFEVRADSFPVAWARPFLDPRAYTALDGALTADIQLTGTQADPRLDGSALLEGGRIGLAAVGRVYETITAPIRFVGNQVLIENATIADPDDGEVELTAEGSITLPKLSVGELDIRITPNRFVATETDTYDGLVLDEAGEPIRFSGTLDRPVLRGAVVLAEGDIYLTDELVAPQFEDVTLTDEELRIVEARFGRRITARDTSVSRFSQALDLDLSVEIERDVWLRSDAGLAFDIEFRGDVRAVKTPFAVGTNLYGGVEVTRGSLETLGRRFEIERGNLTFNGPTEETLIDLQAALDIRTDPSAATSAVQITLAVAGRLGNDLTITLSSDPALDNADIVSLIATGRLAEDFFGGGALGGGGGGLGEGFLVGQLAGLVEGVAGNTLGLDVVNISQEPGGLVIELGKYITNRAFVTVGYPLGGEEQGNAAVQVTLEYALLRWLLAQVEYDAAGTGNTTGSSIGVGAAYEYSY